jgi:hypothetical protein
MLALVKFLNETPTNEKCATNLELASISSFNHLKT